MTLATDLRRTLIDAVAELPGPVGIALSGGMDSAALAAAFAATDRRDVQAYSFGLKDRISTDLKDGRRVSAHLFYAPSIPVWLPTELDVLQADVRRVVELGLKGKSDVECVWPYLYLLDRARSDGMATILTGIHSDWYYGLSRKAAVQYHVQDSVQGMQRYRDDARAKPDRQVLALNRYAEPMVVVAPYAQDRVAELFDGLSWQAVNLPRQKEPLRAAFPELDALRLGKHTNLQLGDSGIADHFQKLVHSPLNVEGHRSVVGIYNALAMGRV